MFSCRHLALPFVVLILCPSLPTAPAGSQPADRKAEYVSAVTRGAGMLPWQQPAPSEAEKAFRKSIEDRKTDLLANRIAVSHPALITKESIERARRNIAATDWARKWYDARKEVADHTLAQPADYIDRMIPKLTPTNPYGLTCPNCVGKKTQECLTHGLMDWDYRSPEKLTCLHCGHSYPSAQYPETARLVCPRTNQTFTFYLNDQERANPEDRSGKLAWHWVGRPIHVSFEGVIRKHKIVHMAQAAEACAMVYRISGEPRYAQAVVSILNRFARCYRNWLYHDYWDTIADCDPMYAAWHDKNLPIEFKRHLCADAYAKDTVHRAAMLRDYWGAGRIHPSTDLLENLTTLATAYDLVNDARNEQGRPLWTDNDRSLVERDLLLEYIMGAEPYVGGADQATTANNKVPRIYQAMAAIAVSLGLPKYADTALRGYEAVRDECFRFDGFSKESPSYNNMYLSSLVQLPEAFHGFTWPAGFPNRTGQVDLYAGDPMLRNMFRAMFDSLRPDGRYAPLSDSGINGRPGRQLAEIGLNRYPEDFTGRLPALGRNAQPTDYAVFNLEPETMAIEKGLCLPEILFPAWMVGFLRHGEGPNSSMLAFSFSPYGPHRHSDNLGLFYADRNRPVLGDHGYVGDMPLNQWIHSTVSHNLVVVDDAEQKTHGRTPRFHRMVSTPYASVVEASSDAYPQCSEYRRLVTMIKGPGSETFAIDIFRVQGGAKRHDYRLFSDLAASDSVGGALEFTGLKMPPEPPLPQIGASLKKEDIFGLRDVRGVAQPPNAWQAVWKERDNQFRVWMLTPADRVEASNGPGQQTRDQIGRRVRYLDVIRVGADLKSTFVAILEPSGPRNALPISSAERLAVPTDAGADAVAILVRSAWGEYLLLSEFKRPAAVAGVRFAGTFGLFCKTPQGKRWLLTSGASELRVGDFGFDGASSTWAGKVVSHSSNTITVDQPRPADWPTLPDAVRSYVAVRTPGGWTGLPVARTQDNTITVDRFPPPANDEFSFQAVRWQSEE